MQSFDFLQKNKKALVVVGVIMTCVSIVFSACTVEKNVSEKSSGLLAEISESENLMNDLEGSTTGPSFETQPEQETISPVSDPTEEMVSTEELESVLTSEYELIYEGINVFNSVSTDWYIKYKDIYADLYIRHLQEETGEYVELSLWSDQKEIWHTVGHELIFDSYLGYFAEDNLLFWWGDSEHLSSKQRLCYYVVPVDETVYLMRYCVEVESNAVIMSYKVFGIESDMDSQDYYWGHEVPFDADSISLYLVTDVTVDPAVSFPVDRMTAFADTVEGYMESGYLVASNLHGSIEFDDTADRDNPISPYLYDIFPWIPEMAVQHSINMENIHSSKELLTALQNTLPTDTSVTMPDVAADGNHFITGDYYSGESYLTVRMKEDESYGGTLLIDNLINIAFAGRYDNGILSAAKISDYPDDPFYEMEISFKAGIATVTFTAAIKEGYVRVGDTFTLDRNEKPEQFEYLKNAEDIPRE